MSKNQHVLPHALASERRRRSRPATQVASLEDLDRRLWYCTTDPANLALAERLAASFGLRIEHHEPRDGAVPGLAILIDGDFWWSSQADLEWGLDLLLARKDRFVVAVHGWRLDDNRVAQLIAGGIHASNRLDRDLMALIAGHLAGLPPCIPVPISIP